MNTKSLLLCSLALGVLVASDGARAGDPCQSGLQCGQRPGPYAFLVATGPNRGKSHCFVCETADRPAVIVFARSTSEPLGQLLVHLDKALVKEKAADLRAWATFLSDDQPALDPKLSDWSRKLGLSTLPLGVFEDNNGPPSYRLNSEADVTILLYAHQKVIANFAFRKNELTKEKVEEIKGAVGKMVGKQ